MQREDQPVPARPGRPKAWGKLLATLWVLVSVGAGASAAQQHGPLPPSKGTRQERPILSRTALEEFGFVPLTDMGSKTYQGFPGGLYGEGDNVPPADHAAAGLRHAAAIQPLGLDGKPSPDGKYVLLSIGMSNTTQEFCSQDSDLPCGPWTFMGQAAADPEVDHTRLVIVNGAMGGEEAVQWDAPDDLDYDRIRDTRLAPQGLSERQVQIAWVKVANKRPAIALPSPRADAYAMERVMGDIVRALKQRYPNLRQVFVSSRIYAGYANTPLNPEPYAYETGFGVKWLVEAQIEQMRSGGAHVDEESGDLNYERGAPWVAWGPYFWADGLNRRSDGLVWRRSNFGRDGIHPNQSGERKVAIQLLEFFKGSPFTRCWFLAGESCSGEPAPDPAKEATASGTRRP